MDQVTTNDDFEVYVLFIDYWMHYFGQQSSWHWSCEHKEEGDKTRIADVQYLFDARVAFFGLFTSFDSAEKLTVEMLCNSACHEVVHLLLAPLVNAAEAGLPRGYDIVSEEHAILHAIVKSAMRSCAPTEVLNGKV